MDEKRMERRRFLKIAGCGTLVVLAGGGCALANKAEASCPYGMVDDPYPGQCRRYVDQNGDGLCDLSQASSSSAATAVPAQAVDEGLSSSAVVCTRGCQYPGECSRYVDTNGTGICDWSEMTSVDTGDETVANQQAAATTAGRTAPQGGDSRDQVLCNRRCTPPGHCRRFVDSDGSGICDWSEA